MTDDRRQTTDDRRQTTDDRRQTTDDRRQTIRVAPGRGTCETRDLRPDTRASRSAARACGVSREACGPQSWQTRKNETKAKPCQTDSETIATS